MVEAVEKQAPVPVLTSFLTIPLAGGDPPNITGIGFLLDPENGGGAYTAPVSMRGEVPFYGDLRNSAHLHITNDAIDH